MVASCFFIPSNTPVTTTLSICNGFSLSLSSFFLSSFFSVTLVSLSAVDSVCAGSRLKPRISIAITLRVVFFLLIRYSGFGVFIWILGFGVLAHSWQRRQL